MQKRAYWTLVDAYVSVATCRRTWGQEQSFPEAEVLLVFARAMKAANLPAFLIFKNAKKITDICVVLQKMTLSKSYIGMIKCPRALDYHQFFLGGEGDS